MSKRYTWYSLVVFLTSAIVMVLEIAAGRLLAPYLGVSLYTWTSIIGIVLAGLSLGSFIGGRWADAGATDRSAGLVIALAGLFALLSLWLLGAIAPRLQTSDLTLLSASFIYMLVLFFIPATLLGIVMPLLTTLALGLESRAGHVVGRMHALGALGSILGTFITGFWLVQTFGTRSVVVICGVLLLALATPFFFKPRTAAVAMLALALAGGWLQARIPTPCDTESSYFCLRVVDVSADAPFGEARGLVLDHLLHGANHATNPEILLFPPMHAMDEIVRAHFDQEQYPRLAWFFAGGGAYSLPRAVKHLAPDARVVIAEIDPAVTRIVREHLFVDTEGMEIFHQDARIALPRHADASFDVIIGDVFHDISVPYHLLTREYVDIIANKLNDDGLFMINLVDSFPNPRLAKAFIKTLQTRFEQIDVWLNELPAEPTRMTYVISAHNGAPLPMQIVAQNGLDGEWFNLTRVLLSTGDPLDSLPLLSDDYVPVEKLIASLLLTTQGN